jgi:hypothetical protein
MGIAVALFVFAAAGLAWYLLRPAVDPQLQAVRDTQQKLVELPDDKSREERRELFGQMREQIEQLEPEQRTELFRGPPPAFVRAMHKRISPYFELPADERVAFLDREIRRMEEMMRDMRPLLAAAAPFGRDMSPERMSGLQKHMLDSTTPIQRAQMSEFIKDVQQRRQELGLPAFPAPPF